MARPPFLPRFPHPRLRDRWGLPLRRILLAVGLTLCVSHPAAAASAMVPPTVAVSEEGELDDWMARSGPEADRIALCLEEPGAGCRELLGARALDILARARSLAPIERVELVNALVNRRPYTDRAADGSWRSPAEVLRDGGDCLEVALAKAVLLRVLLAGEAVDGLAVVAGLYRTKGDSDLQIRGELIQHAVVRLDLGGTRWVLDLNANLHEWGSRKESLPLETYYVIPFKPVAGPLRGAQLP